ncbi:PIN domain-containing protein [Acidianus sp. HS-5]|uniref:PIN domain-containing protein n=1 Tax=Acidianus sp. HS-5 TaxID=2886040 RepID=UPI001F3CB25B|nr:PIN domain-containing protein [Acidianus sp. HS-5]BDC17114.1 hypothetical protein HS5_00040 [Acidianus sp. HS-5]
MILGVLGSDKLVTTTNAVLTEIFTGLRDVEKIVILSEEKSKRDYGGLKDVIKILGIDAEIEEVELGRGLKSWRNKLQSINLDVADITPGRKYMAYSVIAYSKAKNVRYVYIAEEREGYRIFGYIPFNEVKVYNMRDGEEINFDPPKTAKGLPKENKLSVIATPALINIYSLLGKVTIENSFRESTPEEITKPTDDNEELCLLRSGFLRFKEEEEIKKETGSFFIADTNSYIYIGPRLKYLTYSKEYGYRLLASRSIYNELQYHTNSTQKDEKLYRFYMGMESYRKSHTPPLTEENNRFGDMPLIEESKRLKSELPEKLVLVTKDVGVSNTAKSKGISTILLRNEIKGEGNIGEYLNCVKYFTETSIKINEETVATIPKIREYEESVKIKTTKEELNYPYLLSVTENFLKS